MHTAQDLRSIAHRGMSLSPLPMLRYQPEGRHAVREGVAFNAMGLPGPGFNFAAVLGPAPPPRRVMDMAAEFFKDCPGGYGILVEADAGHPMEKALRENGWKIAEDEPALVLPTISEVPAAPPALEIRRVANEVELADYCAALTAGFEAPPEMTEKFAPSLACSQDPDMVFLVGYCEGRAVAGAHTERIAEIATVHGVATIPAYRRRGFGQAITWAAIAAGAEKGCTVAALRAMGVSYDMYRKMGFVHVCNHRTYAAPV